MNSPHLICLFCCLDGLFSWLCAFYCLITPLFSYLRTHFCFWYRYIPDVDYVGWVGCIQQQQMRKTIVLYVSSWSVVTFLFFLGITDDRLNFYLYRFGFARLTTWKSCIKHVQTPCLCEEMPHSSGHDMSCRLSVLKDST